MASCINSSGVVSSVLIFFAGIRDDDDDDDDDDCHAGLTLSIQWVVGSIGALLHDLFH